MNPFQHRPQSLTKDVIIRWTAQPPLRAKLHVLRAAIWADQFGQLANLLPRISCNDPLDELLDTDLRIALSIPLLFGTSATQMQLPQLAAGHIRDVHRSRLGAEITFHSIPV